MIQHVFNDILKKFDQHTSINVLKLYYLSRITPFKAQDFVILNQGYKNVMQNCQENARVLREGLEKTGRFSIVSKEIGVPLVAFSLKDNSKHDEFEISETLRRFGWIVPAYTMPPDAQHITVLRVVIREDFSRTLAERLVTFLILFNCRFNL